MEADTKPHPAPQHPPGHWDRLSEATPADWDAAMKLGEQGWAECWYPDLREFTH